MLLSIRIVDGEPTRFRGKRDSVDDHVEMGDVVLRYDDVVQLRCEPAASAGSPVLSHGFGLYHRPSLLQPSMVASRFGIANPYSTRFLARMFLPRYAFDSLCPFLPRRLGSWLPAKGFP